MTLCSLRAQVLSNVQFRTVTEYIQVPQGTVFLGIRAAGASAGAAYLASAQIIAQVCRARARHLLVHDLFTQKIVARHGRRYGMPFCGGPLLS